MNILPPCYNGIKSTVLQLMGMFCTNLSRGYKKQSFLKTYWWQVNTVGNELITFAGFLGGFFLPVMKDGNDTLNIWGEEAVPLIS